MMPYAPETSQKSRFLSRSRNPFQNVVRSETADRLGALDGLLGK